MTLPLTKRCPTLRCSGLALLAAELERCDKGNESPAEHRPRAAPSLESAAGRGDPGTVAHGRFCVIAQSNVSVMRPPRHAEDGRGNVRVVADGNERRLGPSVGQAVVQARARRAAITDGRNGEQRGIQQESAGGVMELVGQAK